MKRIIPTLGLVFAALAAHADAGLKSGLWEMRIIKHVVDGRDLSGEMAGANAKMQEAMAKLTPEQRAQMGAMMHQQSFGMGDNGAMRVCISPEMAKRDVPVVDKDGACQPVNVQRSGNHMSYEINCTSHGATTVGKGETTVTGDSMMTRSDVTVQEHGTTHHMQSESEMRFIKSDCGDVKPVSPPKHP